MNTVTKMAEYPVSEFVGIVEHIQDTPSYDYCSLNIQSGGIGGHPSVQSLGESIAYQFGKNFRQNITYEPPQGIDTRGTERGLYPRKYHRLSVLEQDRFERAIKRALDGK